MADTATPDVHGLEDCQAPGYHCYWHNVDEPAVPVSLCPAGGFPVLCFECRHRYRAAAELLAEHNKVLASLGMPAETDVEQVHCCPACTHDW
jgi:hypothetical protein